MRVALGFKAHSGWAALVIIGAAGRDLEVIERRRIELIEDGQIWAKQPYHAAEDLEGDEALDVVNAGVESAHRVALLRMREAIKWIEKLGYENAGCAVLVPNPMPEWSTHDILSVHFRMHKAEGVLFPNALCRAAKAVRLPMIAIPEKDLFPFAVERLSMTTDRLTKTITALGKSIGPPWGKDQKSAALAAIVALRAAQGH